MNAGRPLPQSLRQDLEALFSADFTRVRVRDSVLSWPLAWTRGEDVYLSPAVRDPETPAGREVLAHELAHVLQQRAGRVRPGRGRALEAEAAAAGRAVARGQQVRLPAGHARRATLATQGYQVIAHAARGAALAVVNGARNAPTQPTDSFPGQVKGAWAANPGSFKLDANHVNLVSADPATVDIRVSDNGNMAIEEASLLTRQPKAIYLAQGLVNASNIVLQAQGSAIRLVADAADPAGAVVPVQRRIRYNGTDLIRVTPRNVTNNTAGLATQALQSCNALIDQVLGHQPALQFIAPLLNLAALPLNPPPEYHIARALIQPPLVPDFGLAGLELTQSMTNVAMRYSAAATAAPPAAVFTNRLQNSRLNEYAAPNIGQGFLTCSLVAPPTASIYPETHPDFYRMAGGNPMVLHRPRVWSSHYAGVVAVDGHDVITFENYARTTEDAIADDDARYYFQMYSTDPAALASSWHSAWTSVPMQAWAGAVPALPAGFAAPDHQPVSAGARSFANPITFTIG